jgi:hypothetical protein
MAAPRKINSLELDEDLGFQRRSWKIQRVGWAFMLVVGVAALMGLLGGPGVLSTASTRADGLSVHYQRFERFETPMMLRVGLPASKTPDGKIQLRWNRAYLDCFEIRKVIPEPQSVMASAFHLTFVFQADGLGKAAYVAFHLEPKEAGVLHAELQAGDARALQFTQLVYP